MSRQVFNAAGAATVGPYSHACVGGGLLYLSGQTPIDPSTGALVTGSIQAQTQQCLDNLFAVLDAAGLGPDDVINVQVYLVDMRDFTAMNEAYATRFASPYPARTTIGVASLPLGANVEIGLIARTR
jgi:2-iminobutanoate/2-iminopropanoate deaminase